MLSVPQAAAGSQNKPAYSYKCTNKWDIEKVPCSPQSIDSFKKC